MKYKVLELLMEADDKYISGEKISQVFDVSRSYIWKCISSLREEGYEIESLQNKGYKLIERPDRLSYVEIKEYLKTDYIGREIDYFEEIGSTNSYGKTIARDVEEGRVVVAEEQTEGRGRLGREWISSKGEGIYFSIILKPDILPENVSKLTLVGAAGVVLALEEMGIDSYIKWPNDIILGGKKICGILTEMSGELNCIDYIVMGIGINVNNSMEDLNQDIRRKGSSLEKELGDRINRQELMARILNNFEDLYSDFLKGDFERTLLVARHKSILIGREVKLVKGDEEELIRVRDINDRGELLVVDSNGTERIVNSGEVSIRGKHGYI